MCLLWLRSRVARAPGEKFYAGDVTSEALLRLKEQNTGYNPMKSNT